MDMTGERRIPAPRKRVWDALLNPDVLRRAIPGCKALERTGDNAFKATAPGQGWADCDQQA
jgi:carbon monoxide dehydrogenase subunit G